MPIASLFFFFGILSGCIGFPFYGSPVKPDEAFSWLQVGGVFFIFLFFCAFIGALGTLFCRAVKFPMKLSYCLFFGSASAALFVGILGFLPVLAFTNKSYWIAAMLGVLLLALGLEWKQRFTVKFTGEKVFFFAVTCLLFSLCALFAARPQPFWDGLWYNLTASRFWTEAGKIYFPPHFPIAYKTGLADSLFVYGQILLGSAGGGGLIAAQIFGQWLQLGLGAFACLLGLLDLRSYMGWSRISVLLALVSCELFSVACYAKNDWLVCFWAMSALLLFLEEKSPWLVGFAAGLSFSGKYTEAFFLLGLAACFLAREKKQKWLPFFVAAFLAALPLALRNFLATNNPFFPALQSLFPNHWLGPSWQNIAVYQGGKILSLQLIAKKSFLLLKESPAVFGLFLLPFSWKKMPKALQKLALFIFLPTLLFVFFTGAAAEARLLGAALLFLSLLGLSSLEVLLARKVPRALLPGILLLLFLPFSYIPWRAPAAFREGKTPPELIREFVAGSSMAWVRLHAQAGEGVATLNELKIYYLFPLAPIRAFDEPTIDRALYEARNAKDVVHILQAAKIRYVVLSAEFLDLYYRREVCDWLYQLSLQQSQAVAFSSPLSRVLDLQKLAF